MKIAEIQQILTVIFKLGVLSQYSAKVLMNRLGQYYACASTVWFKNDGGPVSKYDGLSKSQLVALLEKHDRTKKLGLVWERDEILADNAIDENFGRAFQFQYA